MKLNELLEKQILTQEELEFVEENSEVVSLQPLGSSGLYIGFTWFDVILKNNERYDVYCRF